MNLWKNLLILLVLISWTVPTLSASAQTLTSQNSLYPLIYKLCLREYPKARAQEKAAYYTPLVISAAAETNLPATVVASVIWHESNYHPDMVSSAGALGLMQVMPFHFRHGENWRDPVTNLHVGCRVLKGYVLQFQGDYHRALTAYCYGPYYVTNRGMSRSRYSRAVLSH